MYRGGELVGHVKIVKFGYEQLKHYREKIQIITENYLPE